MAGLGFIGLYHGVRLRQREHTVTISHHTRVHGLANSE